MFKFTYRVATDPNSIPSQGEFILHPESHSIVLSREDRLGCNLGNFIDNLFEPRPPTYPQVGYLALRGQNGEKSPLAIYNVGGGVFGGGPFYAFDYGTSAVVEFLSFEDGQPIEIEFIPFRP